MHIARFYELLSNLRLDTRQGQPLAACTAGQWPARGVYFFTEPGEVRGDVRQEPRIVRVGTHAVSAGAKSTLWGRLRTHRGPTSGQGNHRGSIFRLHVGAALLASSRTPLDTWGRGSSASRDVRLGEADHERRVSAHIGAMSVLWLDVPDEPSAQSLRASIERNAIALLSNRRRPADQPSPTWLGRASVREEIRESGLWNLNYVDNDVEPAFEDQLAHAVALTLSGAGIQHTV